MSIVHRCVKEKTAEQAQFELKCEVAFPNYFKFNRSDLFHGDYQDDLTRHAFAGYKLAKGTLVQ